MVESRARRVLVVDDEEGLRHMLSMVLERGGYRAVTASDGAEALEILGRERDISLVLCDLRMPRMDGMAFLDAARARWPDVTVIMMSAYGSTESAIEAVKRGAYDFVSKPFQRDEILLTLRKLEERESLARENATLREAVGQQRLSQRLVGVEGGLRKVAEMARKVAASSSTILITGESGTGKEVLARAIHDLGLGADAPFVATNCGAIPENLLESELFGHERGAFTGAVRTRLGLFEQARGGTLLLDEVGEIPLRLQVKLLRVLEDGHLRRLGGERDHPVDARIMAATARDVHAMVARGELREDLFYRLNVVHLHMPPLRDRPEDIPLLVEHFLARHAESHGPGRIRITNEALRIFEAHHWPGNVRQLGNACERAALVSEDDLVDVQHLPPDLVSSPGPSGVQEDGWDGAVDDLSIKKRGAALERRLITRALERTGGNRAQAARLLEISYKALAYKIRDYGIEP